MESNSTRTVQNLLLFTIACTPLFSLREFLKFSGLSVSSYTLYLNLSKDVLVGFIFLFSTINCIKSRAYPTTLSPYFIGFLSFTGLVAGLSLYDPLMVLAGIRWSLPLLLIFSLCTHITQSFLRRLIPVVIFLLVLTTVVQLYQVATKQFHWGPSLYTELLGRVPGFYELPSTTGFITCLSFFIIRYFYKGSVLVKRSLLLLAMVSNFLLSISTTGFILMLIMLVFPVLYRPKKYRAIYIFSTLTLSIVLYFFLDTLNGRASGDSKFSWNVRVALLLEQVHHSQLVSNRFGGATNAVFVLKGAFGKTTDSTIASGGGESFYPPLLGNYGSIFFALFTGLMTYLAATVFKYKGEARCLFFATTLLGALTTRITELFPLGILIAVLAAYFLGNQEEYPISDNSYTNRV